MCKALVKLISKGEWTKQGSKANESVTELEKIVNM